MSFGKMNQKIKIVQPTITTDSEGFSVQTDSIIAEVHAYQEGSGASGSKSMSERWANRATFSTATDLFKFRKIPNIDVTTDMYIICNGNRYNIESVADARQRGMYVEIFAKAVNTSG